MKRIGIRTMFFLLAVSILFAMPSCSKEEVLTTETVEIVTEEETETALETVEPEPEVVVTRSPLTGLPCDESLIGQRPLAIMLNNIKPALPQSGLSKCDIIYEALAEGGILRLEGIILDYANAGILGSVRSARPYYVQIATAYDAIYAHFGGSSAAYDMISDLGVNNLNGMTSSATVNGIKTFYRDQDRINAGVSYEHTAFATAQGLAELIKQRGFRTERNNQEFKAFSFDPEFSGIQNGIAATYIKIPHSGYSVSEFNYDAATKKYLHSQYDAAHVDGITGEQVATENVFILYANHKVVDSAGHREITLVGEGEGYYFNGDQAQQIVWKRSGETAEFKYYTKDGAELSVACGRSYVSIVDTAKQASVTIS